ncbi:enoyl-CoA hydratase/isomerase family protein [Myxococcota bacterium]|nr:enoyl-CoA hydratase/isomerase family protein [Myxococcota bacterium]
MSPPIRTETLREGGVERITLCRPPANILDIETCAAIRQHLATLAGRPSLRLLVFDADGDHFSFGASVAEHLPARVQEMLPGFHRLFVELEALDLPTAAAVRGRCLGGGAELATWCGFVHAAPSAAIAVPEVRLAVFPPVAAAAWRWRVGGARACQLVTTGATVRAEDALAIGLVDRICDDPLASLLDLYDRDLASLSPFALRQAWKAGRAPLRRALRDELPALERAYLHELMAHPDAVEGLTAFVEKRPPTWRTA